MNKTFTSLFMLVVVVGLYGGVRYIGSAIHYGCDPDRILNVEGGERSHFCRF